MTQFLHHPDAAYAAFLTGIVLSYLEFLRPGTILAGVLGATLGMLGLAHLIALGLQPRGIIAWIAAWGIVLVAARWPIPPLVPALLLAVASRFLLAPPRISWWVGLLFSVPCAWLAVSLLRLAAIALANKMRY